MRTGFIIGWLMLRPSVSTYGVPAGLYVVVFTATSKRIYELRVTSTRRITEAFKIILYAP